MPKAERITLQGGPAEGQQFDWDGGDLLKWVPSSNEDVVLARMHARPVSEADPIRYRRSLRSRSIFVYQP